MFSSNPKYNMEPFAVKVISLFNYMTEGNVGLQLMLVSELEVGNNHEICRHITSIK